MSHLQRTTKEQKNMGREYGIVERFCHNVRVGPGIRSDLFDIFDVVAMKRGQGIIGVQVCGDDFAAHYRKITIEKADKALMWLDCGGKIEIWSWRKLLVKRGGKARRWFSKVVQITHRDFKQQQVRKRA